MTDGSRRLGLSYSGETDFQAPAFGPCHPATVGIWVFGQYYESVRLTLSDTLSNVKILERKLILHKPFSLAQNRHCPCPEHGTCHLQHQCQPEARRTLRQEGTVIGLCSDNAGSPWLRH